MISRRGILDEVSVSNFANFATPPTFDCLPQKNGGRQAFPIGNVTFLGRTVKLRGCINFRKIKKLPTKILRDFFHALPYATHVSIWPSKRLNQKWPQNTQNTHKGKDLKQAGILSKRF